MPSPRRHRILFAALYFAEGAPIGFIWWALPTWLADAGVELERITALTSTLVLPWALKFAWAPAVDALRSRRFTLTLWITVAQLAMGLSLLPLLFLDLATHFELVYACLLVHAFAAATQDVAVDALCMGTVPPSQRGSINGWMQVGMLGGRALFGGGLLLVASRVGLRPVVGALIVAVWGALAVLWWTRPAEPPPTPARQVATGLWAWLRTGRTWLAVVFAVVAGAAYEGTAAVAGPFLRERGVSTDAVAVLFAGPAIAAMAIGALLGGRATDRRGARRSITAAQLAVVGVVLALAGLDGLDRVAPWTGYALMVALYVAVGGFTASTYALFMTLADGPARATAFSTLMAMTNVCEMWAARSVGAIHTTADYAAGFWVTAAVSAAALAAIPALTRASRPTRG